ncbi:MAG: PAS domain-containing protein [Nitrospirae bacterium]|nr:MAG: PAS domain-containing protein [Nitrospirota bacterium]
MKSSPEVIVLTENPALQDFAKECFGDLCMVYPLNPTEKDLQDISGISPGVIIVDTKVYSKNRAIQKDKLGCNLLILIGEPESSLEGRDFDILLRNPFDLLILKEMVLQCATPSDRTDEEPLKTYLFELLKRLSNALEEAYHKQTLLDSVLDCISSGVIVTDLDGRIIMANPEAKNILKDIEKEIEGKLLADILGKERADRILRPQKDRPHPYRNELVLHLKNGKALILGYTTTERKSPTGKITGKIISFRNLTELKELQYEVEKLNRFSMVAEITSAVAHEIRNPLAGIRAMAQAIDEALPEGNPHKQYTQRILKQADRLNDILKSFFNYAKPPAPQTRPVGIADILNDIEPLIANSLNKKSIKFVKKLQPGLPRVLFDPTQLQQVLLNLILNSIDAVEEGRGTIEVMAELIKDFYRAGDKVIRIEVRDNGAGIPEHLQERVFMPFFTTKPWGTGLGLAVVKRIVEENGGKIEFTSKPGKGTAFSIYLKAENGNENRHKMPVS